VNVEFPFVLPLYVCANHSEHRMMVGSAASVWVAERTKVCAAPGRSKRTTGELSAEVLGCDVGGLYGIRLTVTKFH
jgi:hypothetical protein